MTKIGINTKDFEPAGNIILITNIVMLELEFIDINFSE